MRVIVKTIFSLTAWTTITNSAKPKTAAVTQTFGGDQHLWIKTEKLLRIMGCRGNAIWLNISNPTSKYQRKVRLRCLKWIRVYPAKKSTLMNPEKMFRGRVLIKSKQKPKHKLRQTKSLKQPNSNSRLCKMVKLKKNLKRKRLVRMNRFRRQVLGRRCWSSTIRSSM